MKKGKILFNVDPQPGEDVYLLREFRGSHGHIFAMAVSNQALYVSQQNFALKNDGWHFKRVPLNEVKEVSLGHQKRIYLLGLSILMIAFGAIVSFLMMWRAFNPMPGAAFHVSGWPMAIAIGGIIVPFIAKDRTILFVKLQRGTLKWKPQLSVDKKTRETCARLQNEILQACKRVGISSPPP